ncbi:MAG: DUF4349 domain-containing protein [Chloroflexi bacterium]|nr:DUF4349 domain-containing protein [Chloroflexota bacterium]
MGRIGSRKRFVALAAVVVLTGGVACSAIGTYVQRQTVAPTTAPAVLQPGASVSAASPAARPAPANTGGAQPAAAARAASGGSDATTSTSAAESAQSTVADTSAQVLDRMVIRTAQLTIEVQEMETGLAQVRAIASRAGGFVSASDTHVENVNGHDNMVANLTLEVRSDSADSAMSDLRALGKVTAETSGSQDVTDEYVDLDSNLRNLQASESAILKLMDRATQIQDVLSLQRELTNVRGQIERIQGRKTYLERRTDMATITVALRLPAPASTQPVVGGAWDPIATALRGWQASLAVLRGAADVLIVVLAFSWWLIPFIALGGYVFLRRRRPIAVVQPPVAPEGA